MLGVLFAERAVLGKSEPVRIVALIFIAVVIAMLALGAFEINLRSDLRLCCHFGKLRTKKLHPFCGCEESLTHEKGFVNLF